MAKLTLTFKDRTLQVTPLNTGVTSIGREADNDISIDSLAIAPRHAVIRCDNTGVWVKQIDPRFPIWVNNLKVTEKQLAHGDSITIGKHLLHFTDEPHRLPIETTANTEEGRTIPVTHSHSTLDASLQILNGKNIGLMIPLRSGLTRLGKDSQATAVIARRREGYFLSALTGAEFILVNDNPVNDESVPLRNGDTLQIADNLMQFFHTRSDLPSP